MSLASPSTGTITSELDSVIEAQEQVFLDRQPRSRAMIAQARTHLAGGATSNWQIASPQAVWLSHGAGSKVYDVDGTEYVDLHGGYGVSLAGHAHPAIVSAIRDRAGLGTHFAQPTPDAIEVATNLAQRFGLPQWRFGNSGTEATMDAIHLMRALTGRDLIRRRTRPVRRTPRARCPQARASRPASPT
jgi:glutamate-1-semialdehyde 2,1-aminomutase